MQFSGQSLKRFEDHRLLTGNGAYVDDLKLPGMVHAGVIRSPHAHACIISIDSAEALAFPGVLAVYTASDLGPEVSSVTSRTDAGADDLRPVDHPILATEKVCYVGQAVAVVVAEDPYTLGDAMKLVQVEYAPLTAVMDPVLASTPESPLLHPEIGTNVAMRVTRGGGDVEGAFERAHVTVSQRYDVQRLAPAPMEPRGAVAEYEPRRNMVTLRDSTQNPHGAKRNLVKALNRTEDSVRVVTPDVGGGFGEKGQFFPEEVAIPYIATLIGRPVKWIEDRQENTLCFHGRGYVVDVDAAADAQGKILAMRVRLYADLGGFFLNSTATIPVLTSHRLTGPYHIPAMHLELLGVVTNKPPTGPYRGAGGPEAAFCTERTVDLIATELGLDPAEVRRRNFIPPDAFPYHTTTDLTYDSGNYAEAFDRVLEMADYQGWREKSRQSKDGDGPLIGVGLATVVKGSGATGAGRTDHARIIIEPSGQVSVYTGISPHGQGTETTFAQLVADELGVAPAEVHVLHGDTDSLWQGGGTTASRGMVVGGSALHTVLVDARRKLSTLAAHLLDCSPEDVSFGQGMAVNSLAPERAVPFAQVAASAFDEELLPPGTEPGLDFSGSYTLADNPYAFGAHVAVMEVDRGTGEAKILRYVAVHDAGRIINPKLFEGQVQGGIVQGIGQALMEGMAYTEDGQPQTASLMDYALPTAEDIPDLELDTMETPSPLTPYGVKGIGELPTVAAPVVIANAVMDALSGTGVRHIDTPLTPEKLWLAMQGKSPGQSEAR